MLVLDLEPEIQEMNVDMATVLLGTYQYEGKYNLMTVFLFGVVRNIATE